MANKVGSRIKNLLISIGIVAHTGCGCEELAKELDDVGAEGVELRLEHYAQKMQNSIRKWKKGGVKNLIPTPPLITIRSLLQWAIDQERQ